MKKLLLFVLLAIMTLFAGCKKAGDNMEFSNMSGVSFYNCQVWFRNSVDGELVGYDEAGNVLMGESAKVKKLGDYCYIYATDARGNMVMTETKEAFDGMSFSKSDLL